MNKYDIIQKRKQDIGRRIRLVNIVDAENDPQMRKLIGQTGTIVKVDDNGSYQVDWDNSGSSLLVLIEDTVEFLDEISEGGKRRMKSKRNTVNESNFGNDDIEFVARNVAEHLAGGFGYSSLSKETYNDFIELISNDETRDLFIEYMNIFYHRYFESEVAPTRKNVNESFDSQSLTNMIKNHGGLISLKGNRNYKGIYDARQNQVEYDLKNAKLKGYIPKEVLTQLQNTVDFWLPLREQLLICNDGGAIVIEGTDALFGELFATKDTPYQAKVRARNDWFREKYGEKKYPYTGVDKESSKYRRELHYGNLDPDQELFFKK